jgi:DNA-binding NarL/FixJ family response regulator
VCSSAWLCDAAMVGGRVGRELEAAGRAAHAAGDYVAALGAYEGAYTAHREAGDVVSAARAARTVGWLRGWVFGEWAVHRGWLSRARTLLEASGLEVGRGWLVLDDALRGSELDTQRALYEEAIALARRVGDGDLECEATASLGIMLVFSGLVDEGMARLDAALATICSGEVAELPVLEGCLCGLLTACERTGDVRRAEEWLRSAEPVMRRGNLVAVAGYCRAHYAGILVAAGRWAEADDELAAALDLLPDGLSIRGSALCRLATLRVRQGRFEEAELLMAGLEHHEDAVWPLVGLHLARAEAPLAVELLDRVVANGPHERHVLAPLLSDVVQARLAFGDDDGARRAAEELAELAGADSSPYLRALAAAARARVCAVSGAGDARACWHQAMSMYAAAGMPADVAAVRLELARLAALDRPTVAVAEAQAAIAVFEEVGDRRRADEAAALLRSLGSTAQPGPKRRTALTRREDEVLALVGVGLTNAAIGERLFISAKTVEHHVGRILAKLGLRSRAEAAAHLARTRAERRGP